MFKNIQKNLLLKYPLIWNAKFVPFFTITLIINIIFLLCGYIYGRIDFTSIQKDNFRSVMGVVAFLSLVIGILTLVLWLIFYFRNNAFKSFYPKGKNSLFGEWILIFILCLLNCSYAFNFEYAYNLRARHYFTKEEALNRMDVICKSSIFIEGSYRSIDAYETDKTLIETDNYNDEYSVKIAPIANDTIEKDSVCYYGNLYHHLSLINKNTNKFSLLEYKRDSLNEFTIKKWMYDQKKDSIRKVMDDFFVLAKEHNVKANITSEEWIDLVYHPKNYTKYFEIGRDSLNPIGDSNYDYELIDTINNNFKIIRGEWVAFPKYHVPFTQMDTAYSRISEGWNKPYDPELITFIFYFAIGFSLLIFSFRVTSGKSWLISAVVLGIAGLIIFIFTIIARFIFSNGLREEVLFISIWIGIILLLGIWFIRIYKKKQSKKLSYILINLLLWLLPTLLPMLWMKIFSYVSDGNLYSYEYYNYEGLTYNSYYPIYIWMSNNFLFMFVANLIATVIYMIFFTRIIRKWKGIAEA